MSPKSKKEYLESILLPYRSAVKKRKSQILNEFCAVCGYHKKHAIRLLNNHRRFTNSKPRKKGRPSRHNRPLILGPLKQIWLGANLPCSSRLAAIIPLWLPFYPEELSEDTRKSLLTISAATIDRVLKPLRIKYGKKGRSTTLKKHIPIKTKQWDETRPGFIEADTVAHCGGSLGGEFAYTVDRVDIATGWTEQACRHG